MLQSPWIAEDTMEYVYVCVPGGGRGGWGDESGNDSIPKKQEDQKP